MKDLLIRIIGVVLGAIITSSFLIGVACLAIRE